MNSKNFKNIDNNNEAVVSEDAGGTDVMDYNNVGHVDDNNYNDDRISNALENNVDNLEVVVIDVTSFVDNNDDGIEGINASRVDDNNDHINIIQNGNNDHGDDEKDNNTNASVVAVEGDTESLQIKCTICLDYPKDVSATSCGHIFCYECIVTAVRAQKMCSICRKSLNLRQIKKLEFKTSQ
ncbi:10841_t:CDS:2 [Entrophospora sp. SA101]|nr:10841_t:CDS:2 [Entrophospora sp. SA101]